MAQGVITEIGRKKLCRAHSGDQTLPAITQMAFGSGGVDADGNVIETTGAETACRYTVRLSKTELANQNISEQGLFDADGDLVAYKTFLSKGKDDDMEFIFDMDEIF